jgi:hypothetical protein
MEKIKKYLGYAKTGFDYALNLVRENAGYATWVILVLAILVIAGAF